MENCVRPAAEWKEDRKAVWRQDLDTEDLNLDLRARKSTGALVIVKEMVPVVILNTAIVLVLKTHVERG